MRISDWSSDVCSSDLGAFRRQQGSRTDRPSHRGDGEGVRPVIVGVPLLRELRMKWSRNMPRNQRIITPDDIMDLGAFETIRAEKRQENLLRTRLRRLSIGPHVSVHFENWDTMWWQVHELLGSEKGGEEELKEELAAYNPLIPNGSELNGTLKE